MLSGALFDISFIVAILFAIGCVACGFMFMNINMANEKQVETENEAMTGPKPAEGDAVSHVDPGEQPRT